jgi:hypothetical protein
VKVVVLEAVKHRRECHHCAGVVRAVYDRHRVTVENLEPVRKGCLPEASRNVPRVDVGDLSGECRGNTGVFGLVLSQ